MMTKADVAAEYTLTDRGTVSSPGKFEGEPWYVVALWGLVLDGGADMETGEDPSVSWFRVDSNLTDLFVSESMTAEQAGDTVGAFVEAYPVGSYVGLYEDSQGFVRVTSSDDPETEETEETEESPIALADDGQLIALMKRLRFVEDPTLKSKEARADLIEYFEDAYSNTDQDTTTYAPEFVIVVRRILQGMRPIKLVYLTDFEGEDKSATGEV